ncbi:MAG: phosphodiesterase [Pseudomonadota bacterium]
MSTIAHITDLHLRPPGTLTLKKIDADAMASAAIDTIIRKHPDIDAVLATGDITDLGEEEAYQRAAMLLSRFSVPVYVMPGNHDRTGALREAFAASPGVASATVPDKVAYTAELKDCRLIVLDSSVDKVAKRQHHGALGEAQLAWLDGELAKGGPTLIALHHPPIDVGINFMDAIGLTDRAAFEAVLARHAPVERIVCGHVHRTIVGTFGGAPVVTIPGVAHQVELALDGESRAAHIMEPPAYALHVIGEGPALSHIGYVDDYGAPAAFDDHA